MPEWSPNGQDEPQDFVSTEVLTQAQANDLLRRLEAKGVSLDQVAEYLRVRRSRRGLLMATWTCEDCGWEWPLPSLPFGAECDNCGGPMVSDDSQFCASGCGASVGLQDNRGRWWCDACFYDPTAKVGTPPAASEVSGQ